MRLGPTDLPLRLTLKEISEHIPSEVLSQLMACPLDGESADKASAIERYRRWIEGRTDDFAPTDRVLLGPPARIRAWIHWAVESTGGRNYYNGLPLEWGKIGTKERDEPNAPSIDHDRHGSEPLEYRITSIQVNRSKQNMSSQEWFETAKAVSDYLATRNKEALPES